MNGFDDIYSELIMEHSTNSFNKKKLESPTGCQLGHNPNCGDEIELQVMVKNGIVEDASFTGHGCAISQSSTSIMIDTLRGKTVEQAKKIVEVFIKMIKREKITAKEKKLLGDSVAFENIKDMPARVKCALLSWHTMQDLLENKEKNV